MHGTLAQCEFSMLKTLMVYDMNIREMENYEKIYSNIGMQINQPLLTWKLWQCNVFENKCFSHLHFHNVEENITSAHEKISECKKEIQRAKRIRKNRQGMLYSVPFPLQYPFKHGRQFGLKYAGDRDAFGSAFSEVLALFFFSLVQVMKGSERRHTHVANY